MSRKKDKRKRGKRGKRNGQNSDEPKMRRVTRLTVPDALKIGISLHREGRLEEAGEMYDKILATEPKQPDAMHFKGVLCHQLGRSDEAISLIRAALEKVPDHVDAWNNLGNVLKETGKEADATQAYERVLARMPDHPDANCNIAVLHRAAGRLNDALAHLRTALTAKSDHVDALYNLSLVMHDAGEFDRAAEIAGKALALGRDLPGTYENVASSLRKAGRLDEAVETLRVWLKRDPDNPMATHLLAAYLGEKAPDRASDAYVTETFDGFAQSFDTVLEGLKYRAPELVAEALVAALPDAGRVDEVLDAGCGTGLCGPLVRSRAGRLTGIDLSGKMIDRARNREVYDELAVAELTAYLAAADSRYGAVVCADTLVYFGRLEAAMAATWGAMTPGGVFVFTVEHWADADDDDTFRLEPSGRYIHSRDYVERCLADAGMALRAVSRVTLRLENGKPVAGLLVTCERPPA